MPVSAASAASGDSVSKLEKKTAKLDRKLAKKEIARMNKSIRKLLSKGRGSKQLTEFLQTRLPQISKGLAIEWKAIQVEAGVRTVDTSSGTSSSSSGSSEAI